MKLSSLVSSTLADLLPLPFFSPFGRWTWAHFGMPLSNSVSSFARRCLPRKQGTPRWTYGDDNFSSQIVTSVTLERNGLVQRRKSETINICWFHGRHLDLAAKVVVLCLKVLFSISATMSWMCGWPLYPWRWSCLTQETSSCLKVYARAQQTLKQLAKSFGNSDKCQLCRGTRRGIRNVW